VELGAEVEEDPKARLEVRVHALLVLEPRLLEQSLHRPQLLAAEYKSNVINNNLFLRDITPCGQVVSVVPGGGGVAGCGGGAGREGGGGAVQQQVFVAGVVGQPAVQGMAGVALPARVGEAHR